jgi:hypothetical protein
MKQAGTQLENKKGSATARPQIQLWRKKWVNPNYLAVAFMSATPT